MEERSQQAQSSRIRPWALCAVAAAALLLRLIGIRYGLPAVFNADEPHHVNVAISFGGGSLNPGVFKYPTLWMYLLFGSFGTFFVGWSGLGLLRSISDFGELFVWNPGIFYLIARLLSASCSMLALFFAYKTGARFGTRAGVSCAALLAVSPTLIISAHAAKPDSLMLLLAAAAWWLAVRYRDSGKTRDLLLAAVAAGLCASTQYVAVPLFLLVAAAWWSHPDRRAGKLMLAMLAVPAAFLAGTPYALLDAPAFWAGIQDVRSMANVGVPNPLVVFKNAFDFAGHGAAGGALLLGATGWLAMKRRDLAVFVLVPVAGQLLFLSAYPNGTWHRFLIPIFPGLALLLALAAQALCDRAASMRAGGFAAPAAALVLLLPGIWRSWAYDAQLLLPDTRTQASEWIAKKIPSGKRVLTFNEHASPRLRMSEKQTARMLEKTRAENHPRQRYYAFMAASHPGGGFEVVRIEQDPSILQAPPGQVARSAAGRETLDVRQGLAAAKTDSIDAVVTTSFGSNKEGFRALTLFMKELEREGSLLTEFRPKAGRTRGPVIRIFSIGNNQ